MPAFLKDKKKCCDRNNFLGKMIELADRVNGMLMWVHGTLCGNVGKSVYQSVLQIESTILEYYTSIHDCKLI